MKLAVYSSFGSDPAFPETAEGCAQWLSMLQAITAKDSANLVTSLANEPSLAAAALSGGNPDSFTYTYITDELWSSVFRVITSRGVILPFRISKISISMDWAHSLQLPSGKQVHVHDSSAFLPDDIAIPDVNLGLAAMLPSVKLGVGTTQNGSTILVDGVIPNTQYDINNTATVFDRDRLKTNVANNNGYNGFEAVLTNLLSTPLPTFDIFKLIWDWSVMPVDSAKVLAGTQAPTPRFTGTLKYTFEVEIDDSILTSVQGQRIYMVFPNTFFSTNPTQANNLVNTWKYDAGGTIISNPAVYAPTGYTISGAMTRTAIAVDDLPTNTIRRVDLNNQPFYLDHYDTETAGGFGATNLKCRFSRGVSQRVLPW